MLVFLHDVLLHLEAFALTIQSLFVLILHHLVHDRWVDVCHLLQLVDQNRLLILLNLRLREFVLMHLKLLLRDRIVIVALFAKIDDGLADILANHFRLHLGQVGARL